MGLSIYKWDESKSYVTNIESISDISDALNELEKKSGITIDEYGKTRLYLDHIVFLHQRINHKSEWKDVFENSIRDRYGLIIEGD